MANNYTQATVTPYLPRAAFTDKQLEALAEQGFTYEQDGDELYFYLEDGLCESEDSYYYIFQKVCRDLDIPEVVIEGAFTCDKLRPGEFGGFIIRITKDNIQEGGTGSLLEQFRQEHTTK